MQPLFCDCEAEASCEAPAREIASAVALNQIDNAHYRARTDGEHAARQLAIENEVPPPRSTEEIALDPIDPYLPSAKLPLESEDDRKTFETTYGITPPEHAGARGFRGAFRPHDQSTVAIYVPGDSLSLYRNGQAFTALPLDQYEAEALPDSVADAPARVIDLVRGGTVEIELIHALADAEGDGITYFIGIYKLIGNKVGTIFYHPIARRDEDGEVTRFADLRFLHGVEHRTIQWISLDEDGQPAGEPLHYEWNRWEGVYRIPSPPPTAPNRQQPQS